MLVLSALRHLFHRNGVARPQLIESLGAIEELILTELGVVDAYVSVKTNPEHRRCIQIMVLPTDRYKHREQFRKLQQRIITVVAPRIGGSSAQIQVMRMKKPAPHASSPDPPLP